MVAKTKSLPPLLCEKIHPSDARGLGPALGIPASASEMERHVQNEIRQRVNAFDEHFCCDSKESELPIARLKAVIEYAFDVPADDPHWVARLTEVLMRQHLPSFSISNRKRGRPREWPIDRLLTLRHDIQTLRKNHPHLSIKRLCAILIKDQDYKATWGKFTVPALCKAHTIAVSTLESPSLKWSDLKYVIWHQGGLICRGRDTSRRRSSPS